MRHTLRSLTSWLQALQKEYDTRQDGRVAYLDFVRDLRGPIPAARVTLLKQVWSSMDEHQTGRVSLSSILDRYMPGRHPMVTCQRMSEAVVRDELCMAMTQRAVDGLISWESFLSYQAAVSATVLDDTEFTSLIWALWDLAGTRDRIACLQSFTGPHNSSSPSQRDPRRRTSELNPKRKVYGVLAEETYSPPPVEVRETLS